MSLPEEVRVEIRADGMIFKFCVLALPEGCRRMFPDQVCADEFRISPDLSAEVVRAAASVLDAAATRFAAEFGVALTAVLARRLDKVVD